MGLGDVPLALKEVFSKRGYLALAALFSFLSMALYVAVPVLSVPGNTLEFFLAASPLWALALMGLLSMMMGSVISMQAYCWRNGVHSISGAGVGFFGFVSGAMSTLFATATCASCVSAIFSVIGFGGALFLIEHSGEIFALTGLVVGLSLYFTSERIARGCRECRI